MRSFIMRAMGTLPLFFALSYSVTTYAEENTTQRVAVLYPESYRAIIKNVRLAQQDGKVLIKGEVRRRSKTLHVPSGHIDLVVVDSKGNVLAETASYYTPAIVNRDSRRASKFRVTLPMVLPMDAEVRVAYHPNALKEAPVPVHDKNVAR